MYDNVDIDRLRQDIEDDLLGIMFNVSPAALVDLSEVENATDEEIIEILVKEQPFWLLFFWIFFVDYYDK